MPKRQMLINYVPGEECRIAITEDGRLEEFYQERASNESHVGNIYKGKVCNVEPSIQAAFVEFGLERNGFLHISDLHPMYFPGDSKEETEQVGLKTPRRDRPPIQKCLRRGQEILVQVLKEGIGTKGPTLTSYLSIPGRYLVMMPNMERTGVSRKVEDDEARRAIRDILDELKPPDGFGFIIRTAAIGRTKTDMKRELAYLQRLWKNIDRRMKEVRIGELFAESDLVIRTIRDVYSSDIERIVVDEETAARRARDFLSISNPRSGSNVLVYRDRVPLFHRFDIERQIETINAKTVPLPSGGSLVIESTEALVAIDVNSGKYRDNRDAEMTAYKTNLEATDEICRQLRLRDLGGVVVNDLIDMRSMSHRREIEQRFRENLKRDRAKTRTLPISQFGILEMTRQRMRPSLKKSLYTDCPSCAGAGLVKSPESVVLDVMRRLALAMHRQQVARLELTVSPDVAFQLLNRKRAQLVGIEQMYDKPVTVRVNGNAGIDFVSLAGFDIRGGAVEVEVVELTGEPELAPVEGLAGDAALFEEEEPTEVEAAVADEGAPAYATAVEPSEAADHAYGVTNDTAAVDSSARRDGPEEESEPAPDEDHEPAAQADRGGTAGAGGGGDGGEAREGGGRHRRRRRRRGRRGRGSGAGLPPGGAGLPTTDASGATIEASETGMDEAPMGDAGASSGDPGTTDVEPLASDAGDAPESAPGGNDEINGNVRLPEDQLGEGGPASGGDAGTDQGGADQGAAKRRRRRRGGRGRRGRGRRGGSGGAPGAPDEPGPGGGGPPGEGPDGGSSGPGGSGGGNTLGFGGGDPSVSRGYSNPSDSDPGADTPPTPIEP